MSYFTLSALAVIAAFCLLGVFSSGGVKNSGDYAVAGRKAGAVSVAGVLMGTLVSGGATVGTVQMAYQTGLSGWWFTLGSGIGCFVLGVYFARSLRATGLNTLPEFIEFSYGRPTAFLSLLGSVGGSLLTIASQFMAGIALLRAVFPLSPQTAATALVCMVLLFIFTGGMKSFSAVGKAKIAVLYLMMIICVIRVSSLGQGMATLISEMPFSPWLDLLGRGAGKDLGACASLVLGILCSQIYIQAVFSARDERVARNGCLISAFLIPPLGLMSVWIGLALRNAGIVVEPAQALPYFLNAFFHPAIGGALWAILVITAVGGGAGICLGVATNLSNDLRVPGLRKDGKKALLFGRCALLLTVAGAAVTALTFQGGLILHLSYISLSLRVCGMIVPLLAAVFRPGLLSPNRAFASSLLGFSAMVTTWVFLPNTEPLFIGVLASLIPLLPLISRHTERPAES